MDEDSAPQEGSGTPPNSESKPRQTKVGWIAIVIGIALGLAFGGYMGWISLNATQEAQDALMHGNGP